MTQLDVSDEPRVECSCLEDKHTITPPREPFRGPRSWRLCYFDSSDRGATRDALRARALRGQGIVVHHEDLFIRGSRQELEWTVIDVVILKDRMVENWSRRTRSRPWLSLGRGRYEDVVRHFILLIHLQAKRASLSQDLLSLTTP